MINYLNMFKRNLFVLFFLFGLLIYGGSVLAQATTPITESAEGASYSSTCKSDGNCSLSDFVILMIRVSQFFLGITGSLTLIAFVYGGVTFLISAGSSEMVTKAKKIIFGAVIGVFIVFLSYLIIGFVFKSMGVENWAGSTSQFMVR